MSINLDVPLYLLIFFLFGCFLKMLRNRWLKGNFIGVLSEKWLNDGTMWIYKVFSHNLKTIVDYNIYCRPQYNQIKLKLSNIWIHFCSVLLQRRLSTVRPNIFGLAPSIFNRILEIWGSHSRPESRPQNPAGTGTKVVPARVPGNPARGKC